MRKLPVYLLLDVSASMSGEPIEAVKNGVQVLISSLRQDPYALETAYLSIITFSASAKQIVPLTELSMFQMPELQASGTTSLGGALSLLASKVETEITKTTLKQKGDWKPLVFIMTDGAPTDDWKKGLEDFKKQKFGVVVACAAGQQANTNVLKEITEIVVQLDTTDISSIKAFFKWVSASISIGSQKIESTGQEIGGMSELPPPPPEVNIVV
ncbi:VWA domain-containing protein [Dysgonomonas sp. Marseille-P4677]|uniref:vWA domain-containing protein n=1 Tax=Dysgonomonas sp. Marseille-P4677 TaxID=2364790 RepID=UPI001912EE0E|nr:VWA domain-containing protein [Dysgonomonas sp. Marseille-P4677]MBK5720879.1 VWA domain-containing protein [Dysgonomonas sp. Marseille-P4677]